MRTALFFIFLGLNDIASALYTKEVDTPDNVVAFVGWVIMIAMVMDVLEFFKKMGE